MHFMSPRVTIRILSGLLCMATAVLTACGRQDAASSRTPTPHRSVTVTNLSAPAVPRCWGDQPCPDYEDDAAFINNLDIRRIPYADAGSVIVMGRTACDLLRSDVPPAEIVIAVQARNHASLDVAVAFLWASIYHICPDLQR